MELSRSQTQMLIDVSTSTKAILDILTENQFQFFSNGDYNLNIIGERNLRFSNVTTNTFDDFLHVIYKIGDSWKHHIFNITTDPGKYWMNQPGNSKGVAILAPGQYRGAYSIAKHRGQYDALCQRKGAVTVYRDNNGDDVYDFIPDSKEVGFFGINIHRSNPYNTSNYVDKWSAGCQVFADPEEFNIFMDICYNAADIWGNTFTYTLVNT